MKLFFRCLVMTGLTAALLMPLAASADEPENLATDAQAAEGMPPTVPHRVKETADGTYCLSCHRDGLKKAPVCPHPERLTCTECHVPANPDAPAKKAKKVKPQP